MNKENIRTLIIPICFLFIGPPRSEGQPLQRYLYFRQQHIQLFSGNYMPEFA